MKCRNKGVTTAITSVTAIASGVGARRIVVQLEDCDQDIVVFFVRHRSLSYMNSAKEDRRRYSANGTWPPLVLLYVQWTRVAHVFALRL